MNSRKNYNRRDFLKKGALSIAVTSTCLCGLNGCATLTKVGDTPAIHPDAFTVTDRSLRINLTREPVLGKVGGAVKVKHPDIPEGLIIAHVDDNGFAIASLLCTHRGVELEYNPSEQHFECASLGSSTFSLKGRKTGGPAEKPLKAYKAVLDDRIIHIELS
jgi:Rieske Fe-S protein